jgi:hypothetical protein
VPYQNVQLGDHHLPMIPAATAIAALAKNHLETGSDAPDATSLPPIITASTPAAKRMPEISRLTIRARACRPSSCINRMMRLRLT